MIHKTFTQSFLANLEIERQYLSRFFTIIRKITLCFTNLKFFPGFLRLPRKKAASIDHKTAVETAFYNIPKNKNSNNVKGKYLAKSNKHDFLSYSCLSQEFCLLLLLLFLLSVNKSLHSGEQKTKLSTATMFAALLRPPLPFFTVACS